MYQRAQCTIFRDEEKSSESRRHSLGDTDPENIDFTEDKSLIQSSDVLESEDTISFQTEIPKQIQQAMKVYIEKHPNWDQYRLVQAALAGFLVQNGIESREITRVYVGNMFRRESLLHGV